MIYLSLFWTFFQIGALTFGGGYAMVALIQQQVINHGWLSQGQLIDFIAISESTPGPLAINVSTFVGYQTGGILGAFVSTLGVVLPSFLVILLVAKIFEQFQRSRVVKGAMLGLKGVVVGLIAAAVWQTFVSIFAKSLVSGISNEFVIGILLFVLFFILLHKKANPILLILGAAFLGEAVSFLL